MADQGFYDDPALYDILHAPGTALEVDGLERMALRFAPGRPDRHVWLEPACGTGRYLRLAARRGRRVIGVDISSDMIAYARRRLAAHARRTTLLVGDMQHIDNLIPPATAHFAFNLINTIRHLHADKAVLRHLDAMARVMKPRAVYAVGLSMSDYDHEMPSEDVWEGARGRCRVTQTVQYLPPNPGTRRETVISHFAVERPRGIEHIDSRYELRAYDPRQWRRLIDRSPFMIEACVDELSRIVVGDRPGYAIWILRRR